MHSYKQIYSYTYIHTYIHAGLVCNSGEAFDNLTSELGRQRVIEKLSEVGLGQEKVGQKYYWKIL